MENSNISLEEIQKSNLIIKAISSYYTSRIVGQRNLQISLLVSLFETQIGPVYANFVLLDEINRSSSKTQSAMLEAI